MTPPERPTPSELLTAAADYIEQRGWTQGREQNDYGAVCTLMALRLVALVSPVQPVTLVRTEAEHALEAVALELWGRPISVPMYNDLGCYDQADAVAWIQKASCHLQEQGR